MERERERERELICSLFIFQNEDEQTSNVMSAFS